MLDGETKYSEDVCLSGGIYDNVVQVVNEGYWTSCADLVSSFTITR
jgi:hypothetical protein